MIKVKPTAYQLSSTLNDRGTVFQSSDGDILLIAKKVTVSETSAHIHSCEKLIK
jgi:hypothetical protein